MNLKKTLRSLDPQQKIKVGSKESSSFWYIGTAEDLLKNIEVYSTYCKLYIEKIRKRAETRLNNAIANYPTPEEYIRYELQMSKPNLTTEGYMKTLNAWFASVAKLQEKKQIKAEWDDNFVKLAAREVVDCFMSDPNVDYGVMQITVHGYEFGKYWIFNEASRTPSCSFGNDSEEGEEE